MSKVAKPAYHERKKERMYANIDIWQGKIARVLVVLMLCVHPLYLNWDRYIRLTYHKFVFFVVCMVIILIAVAIVWVARLTRNPRLLPQDKLSIADWAVLGFSALTILSAIFSPFHGLEDARGVVNNVWVGLAERYDGVFTQLLYVAIYFIVSRWYRPRIRDFTVFGISASIIAFIGILQFYGMDFLKLWPQHIPEYRAENFFNIYFRSTLGNINVVSTYVCVAILLNGFLFIRMTAKLQPLWLAASALSFWLMDLANSDSGLVGVLITVLFAIPFVVQSLVHLGRFLILASSWLAVFIIQMLFYNVVALGTRSPESLLPFLVVFVVLLAAGIFLSRWGKEPDPDSRVKWKHGVILMAVCIMAGFIGVEFMGRQNVERGYGRFVYEAREIMHGNIEHDMGSGRILIWEGAMEAFPAYPILGTGPDTFFHATPEWIHVVGRVSFDKAHNEYIQILICQGILTLLAYLVFLSAVLVNSVREAFRNPLVMAVLAAFFGYCVQAFFNISLPIATQMLWVFAGMLVSTRFRETQLKDLVLN